MKGSRALLLLALLAAACGPSFDKLAADRSGDVRPKLKQIEEAGRAANHVDPGKVTPATGLKLVFQGEGQNAQLLHVEKLNENVSDRKPALDLIIEDAWLTHLSDAYAAPPDELPVEYFTELADRAAALEYLVVVRTLVYSEPAASGSDQFSPGYWQADVLVYELAECRLLGGFAVSASNSDKVSVNEDDPGKWLHSDLWSRARAAVNEALKPVCEAPPFG